MANEVNYIDVKAAPVVIHLKANQGTTLGREFHVNDIGGWGYTAIGVQATGYFHGEPQAPLTIILPFSSIDYIVPDLEALAQYERNVEAAARVAEELRVSAEEEHPKTFLDDNPEERALADERGGAEPQPDQPVPTPEDDDAVDRGPETLEGEAEVGLTEEGLKTDGSEDR